MTTVKHRFAEIHQTHDIINTDKLWSTLTSNQVSVITASSICQKILVNVQTDAFQFNDTLLHLQNLVLTCTDGLKTAVFLRAISVLLQCHAEEERFHNMIEFTLTSTHSSTTTATTALVHPFVIICRQRPELCDDIFFEVDFLLNEYNENGYYASLLDTMESFFDSILLTATTTREQQKTLLFCFTNAYSSASLRTELHYYLVNVLERFPTRRAMIFYLQMVDMVIAVFTSPELPESDLQSIATVLIYQLICRAYDAATYGYPALPYLQRILRIYEMRDICSDQPLTNPNTYLMWPSFSYLLITAQTVNDQDIILKLMYNTIHRRSCQEQQDDFDNMLLSVAMLPLFQTWTEIVDDRHDPRAKKRKALTLDIISYITNYSANTKNEKFVVKTNILQTLEEIQITGAMAHMIPFLFSFIDNDGQQNYSAPSNSVTQINSLLFTTPNVFSSNASTRHSNLDQLARLSSITAGTYSFKFPVFLLVLYLMRSTEIMTTETFLYIYHTVIPSLIDINDPISTAKVLQTVLPMIQGGYTSQHQNNTTVMAAIGFKTLIKIYEHQPRVWHEVKKAMANWILHRKSTLRSDDILAIQMELAVLTSMRDLCVHHPRACAQDILPMVVSLLQSCTDLNIASIALIVDIMCVCINAGLVEPRSLWNVSISYIASFAMEHSQNQMIVLWEKICSFFAIVGDGNEVSESYYELKDNILFNYLEPLMSSDIVTIRSYAYSALAHFPAEDIKRLLPEKAKQFTDEIITEPNQAQMDVLRQLLSHELDHMRRNLFKEDGTSNINNNSQESTATQRQKKDKEKQPKTIGAKEADLAGRFVKAWEQAGVAPGVRTGYTIAVLHTTNSHMNDRSTATGTTGAALSSDSITKAKWYRCMTTSIGDIGLTDHLLIRISCLSGWVSLFETAFGSDNGNGDSTFEIKGTQILRDLLTRLEKSTVPGTTCNILLALTGFVLTIHRVSPSFGVSCATQLIDLLCSKYINSHEQSSSNMSTLVTSDEVQFAANVCLGHIAGCTISNEKLSTQLLNLMLDQATSNKQQNMDTTIDLTQFAQGYAASIYTAALMTWPTKTNPIDNLAKNGLSTLLQYVNGTKQQGLSESRALGIMMGWASKISKTDMYDVCWFASETLKLYSEQGLSSKMNRGVLLGSCWVAAYSAINDDGHFDPDIANTLREATEKASNDVSYLFFYKTGVALAYLNRVNFLCRNETEHFKSFGALLRSEVKTIKDTDVNAATTSILSLGSLLGVDYLSPSIHGHPYQLTSNIRAYSNEARVEALDTLGSSAGVLGGTSLAVGNLKNTRIAAVVCGKLNQVASAMCDAKTFQDDNGNGETVAVAELLLNASTEPKSYSRLSNNTSFLRAVFDSLTQLVRGQSIQQKEQHAIDILLSSLWETPGPLPQVNWFPLLTNISGISNYLRLLAIRFASHHASTSMSLTEYIISQLSEPQDNQDTQKLLASKVGFGKVFELSGLPDRSPSIVGADDEKRRRGMDAVTKKTRVSEMRCIELFESYIELLKTMTTDIQLIFFSTLSDHLPPITKVIDDDEHLELLVKTLRDITYFNITLPLLNGDKQVPKEQQSLLLIQKAVECSVKNSEQVKQHEITSENAYAHCITVTELCRLGRTGTVAPAQLITDTIRQLLIKKIHNKNETIWNQIAKAILQVDGTSTKEKLTWVTRILDTLIVIAGNNNSSDTENGEENTAAILIEGLAHGLRQVFLRMWWTSPTTEDQCLIRETEALLPDIRYMFSHIMYLGNAYPQEQQQMVKRILKLNTLANNWPSKNQLEKIFIHVIRDSPAKAIHSIQNNDQVTQIVISE
ncbi:hypothetical protein INT45_000458 [Circinella minor]|uniref:DUF3730 domain-containing protein n=1 Tax=Circinella minor TaxID=1195481 RepID=A0A8H7S698_9FUNG|nr:hypothetical protein INT45_000458 [Circinella minor]